MMSKSSREAANEGPAVLHMCFCSLSNISVAARTANPDVATVFHARLSSKFVDIQSNNSTKNFINQSSNFLQGSFSNRHKLVTIQFR